MQQPEKVFRYESAQNVVDTTLFQEDRMTFLVLKDIVNSGSRLVITDHENFIICHSTAPYPVWIWTKEGITEEKKELIWEQLNAEKMLQQDFTYNLKYEFAEYMISRGEEEQIPLSINMNLLAYDCPFTIEPVQHPLGYFCKATMEIYSTMVEFLWNFKEDIGIDKEPLEAVENKAKLLIQSERLYVWVDDSGKPTAMCSYTIVGGYGKITHVYTKKSERRKGYAQHLVYEVTKAVIDQGAIPVLYTDADYLASNSCYKQIGYIERGSLCTIGKSK